MKFSVSLLLFVLLMVVVVLIGLPCLYISKAAQYVVDLIIKAIDGFGQTLVDNLE